MIYDVSQINIPEWIEKTYRNYETSRHGGFELQVREKLVTSVTGFLRLIDQLTDLRPNPQSISSDEDEDFFAAADDNKKRKPQIPTYKVRHACMISNL